MKNLGPLTRIVPFLLLFLLLNPGNAHSSSSCEMQFRDLMPVTKEAAKDWEKTHLKTLSRSEILAAVRATRDYVRRWLTSRRGHVYPVIAVEDSTPIKAYAVAADSFGMLEEPIRNIVDVDAAKIEFQTTLEKVENYRQRLQDHQDRAATLAAQIEQITLALQQVNPSDFPLRLPMPEVKVNGKTVEIITENNEFFSNIEQMKKTRDNLKEASKEHSHLNFLLGGSVNHPDVEQAVLIKRLETVRAELIRRMELKENRDKPLPPELEKLLNGINGLYESDGRTLKSSVTPPKWASSNLKTLQFWGELKSVWVKDRPKVLENEKVQELIELVKNLSPEQRRALGFNNFATTVDKWKVWGRYNLIGILITAATSTSPVTLTQVFTTFISDAEQKEHCASEEVDENYEECALVYLRVQFADRYDAQTNQLKSLIDLKGAFTDPEIVAEIKDMEERRQRYQARLQKEKDLDRTLRETVRVYSGSITAQRNRAMTAASEEKFKVYVLGGRIDGVTVEPYFERLFPLAYSAFVTDIQTILNAADEESRTKLLRELAKKNEDLSRELEYLIFDRQQFLTDPSYDYSDGNRDWQNDPGLPDPKDRESGNQGRRRPDNRDRRPLPGRGTNPRDITPWERFHTGDYSLF